MSSSTRPGDGPHGAPPARSTRAWGLAGVAAVGLLLYLLASFRAVAGNSDGATVILEGQAIRAGHLLLRGWSLSLDSFWTIDAAFYAVAVAVAGVHSVLLNVVPSVIAALLLAACVWLATDRRPTSGKASGTASGPMSSAPSSALVSAITVVAVLAFPSRALALVLLAGPLHVGTVLWCVLAFGAAERSGNERATARLWGGLAVVLLAAGLLGDLQALPLGVLPLTLAALADGIRRRRWRPVGAQLVLPLGAVVLALVVRFIARSIGSYAIAPANPFASGHQILRNVGHLLSFGAPLLGLDAGPFGPTHVPWPLELGHVVVAAVVLGGPAVALWALVASLTRRGGRATDHMPTSHLDEVLLFAFLFDIGAFIVLPITNSNAYVRYLTAAVVFGVVLGARTLGSAVQRLPARRRTPAAIVGVALVAYCVAGFGFAFRGTAATRPAAALTPFLVAHGLRSGIGDYWSASIVTVESGDTVTVRPVIAHDDVLVRYAKQSASTWYGADRFHFYVYNSGSIWNGDDRAVAVATFGRPSKTYAVGSYRVLVWRAPLSLATSGWTGP